VTAEKIPQVQKMKYIMPFHATQSKGPLFNFILISQNDFQKMTYLQFIRII